MTFPYKPITLILEFYYKWANFWNIEYKFAKFLLLLGNDLEMFCAKCLGNRYRIDREIDEKHAIQIIVS